MEGDLSASTDSLTEKPSKVSDEVFCLFACLRPFSRGPALRFNLKIFVFSLRVEEEQRRS